MRKFHLAVALLALMTSTARAEQTTFYDQQGRFAGSAIRTSKHGTSFYGPGGSYQGSAVRNGNVTSFYDRNGSLTGAAVAPRR